jgi:hypothetical protein|tara:strand:+ start:2045 stop:2209 length:165 start_codon:yes stop_codon:yes gene_type:complete
MIIHEAFGFSKYKVPIRTACIKKYFLVFVGDENITMSKLFLGSLPNLCNFDIKR